MENSEKRESRKISIAKQNQLIYLVFQKDCQINKAAATLGINYATAKNIITRYRNRKLWQKSTSLINQKRCHYKKLEGQSTSKIRVISQFWNVEMNNEQ